ncbi:MAG: hypothetical protein ACE5OT_06335 [Candidatus Hadarchaeaceae archaeon]
MKEQIRVGVISLQEPSGFDKSVEEFALCGVRVSYRFVSTGLLAWKVTCTFAFIEIFRCSDCGIAWKLSISESYLISAQLVSRTLRGRRVQMFGEVKLVDDSFGPRKPRRLYDLAVEGARFEVR